MLCEANLPTSWRARPRGFIALMGLYESNYLRLRALAGDLMALAGARHSLVGGDCELVLAVKERTPYTSVLELSYLLPPAEAPQRAAGSRGASGKAAATLPLLERYPQLRLRLYHDARLLEAEGSERELHHRWRRNLMLNKWLEYCSDRGHRFTPALPVTG
ncbi:MAG TPA: hypothetical protein VMI92_08465 [Steroidobacteraceae bacterium]|nr:hypothetical protein [Steroidobacteraceae bacterium]